MEDTDTTSDAKPEVTKSSEARAVLHENKQRVDDLQNVHCMLQGKRDAAKRCLEETVSHHLEGVIEWKTAFHALIDSEFVHKTGLLQKQLKLVKGASVGLKAALEKLDALQYSPDAVASIPAVTQQISQYIVKSRQVQPHQLLDFAFQEVPVDRRARSRLALGYLQTGSVAPTELMLSLVECDGLRIVLVVKSSRAYDPATVTQLSYSVRDPAGAEVADVDWKDERDGNFTVTVSAGLKGSHTLSVYLYNVHVTGSPLKIHLTGLAKSQPCDVAVQTGFVELEQGEHDEEDFTSWLREKLEREMSLPSPQTVADLTPGSAAATPVRQRVGSGRLNIPPMTKTPVLDANDNIIVTLPPLPADDWSPQQASEKPEAAGEVSRVKTDGPRKAGEIRRPTAERLRSALSDLRDWSGDADPAMSASTVSSARPESSAEKQSAPGREMSLAVGVGDDSGSTESLVLRRPGSLGGSPVQGPRPSAAAQSSDRVIELFSGLRVTMPQHTDRVSPQKTSRAATAEAKAMVAIAEVEPAVEMVGEVAGDSDLVDEGCGAREQTSPRCSVTGAGDGPATLKQTPTKRSPLGNPEVKPASSDQQKPKLKSVVFKVNNNRNNASGNNNNSTERGQASRGGRLIRVTSDDLISSSSPDFCTGNVKATLDLLIKPDPVFSRPIGVSMSAGGDTIYVADTGNDCVRSFSIDGAEGNHSPLVQCRRPSALATLSGDRIAVRYDYGLRLYSAKIGTLLYNVGTRILRKPFGLACTSTERLVTVDTAARRPTVYVFDASAADIEPQLVHSVDITGAVARPETAKLRFLAASEMRVAVVDLGNNVVYLLSWDGRLVAPVGAGAHLSDPAGCVLDAKGSLLVADSKHHRIMVFGADGTPYGMLDVSSKLNRPSGLCLSGNQLLVLNYWENTAHRYKLTTEVAEK